MTLPDLCEILMARMETAPCTRLLLGQTRPCGLFEQVWKMGGLWTRKAVEYGNQSLTGHPSRTLRVSSAENSLEAQLKRLQREARTLTTTELEATPVIF